MAAPLTTKAGAPLAVTVWARDEGKSATNVAGSSRSTTPLTLTWFKHQGPGTVTFANGRYDIAVSVPKSCAGQTWTFTVLLRDGSRRDLGVRCSTV